MSHFILLKQIISESEKEEDQKEFEIFLQRKQDTVDLQKKELQNYITNGKVLDEMLIRIGKKIQQKLEIANKKGAELILLRLFETIEFLKENDVINKIKKLKIIICNSTSPLISPILKVLEEFLNLTTLEIESVQSLTKHQSYEFRRIITEKLSHLQNLTYDVAITKENSEREVKDQIKTIKQEILKDFVFQVPKQIEDLEILSSFPNLSTLKLIFPISLQSEFIEEALKKISVLVPHIITLDIVILNTLTCNLSHVSNFQTIQNLNLQLKVTVELDLSKLKKLISLKLELPDPLGFFCKQKKLPYLEKLQLLNSEGTQNLSKEENQTLIKKYQKIISQHKNLNSLIISNYGCKPTTLELFKRDLEIISVIINQLKILEVNLEPYDNLINKEIDQDLVNLLCSILDHCKKDIKVGYNFQTTLISAEGKCDLGLAMRKFAYEENLLLNDESIKEDSINFFNSLQKSRYEYKEEFPNEDVSLFLLKLGYIGGNYELTSQVLQLQKRQINFLRLCLKTKNESLNKKIREIFHPFKAIKTTKYSFQISTFFSENLTQIFLERQITNRAIEQAVKLFPKLVEFNGQIRYYNQFIKAQNNSKNKNPMRPIQLNIQRYFLRFRQEMEIFQIKDHFVRVYSQVITPLQISEEINILKLILQQNNRFLFFQDQEENFKQFKGGIPISNYSYLVNQQITFAVTYYKNIANLLPINPLMVFLDLYF